MNGAIRWVLSTAVLHVACSASHVDEESAGSPGEPPPSGGNVPVPGPGNPPEPAQPSACNPSEQCEPEDPCTGLDERSCVAASECVPMYDDACCPGCRPMEEFCGDCRAPEFEACLNREEACSDTVDLCGWLPDDACMVTPTAPDSPCERGFVPAILAVCSDSDDCDVECRPITDDSCTVLCRALPPRCPLGWIAEGDGFCYTGYCIPQTVCPGGWEHG